MKAFYESIDRGGQTVLAGAVPINPYIECRARVAVYDGPGAAPRVLDIGPLPAGDLIEALSAKVYELACSAGGSIPYTVIREVTENLIHADFSEPVVSVLDSGNTIRIADQGPGITDKQRAVLPGFTTARGEMKRYIRGVGSGLPLVKDFLSIKGGSLLIEDNLGSGAVVTLSFVESAPGPSIAAPASMAFAPPVLSQPLQPDGLFAPDCPVLSTRQKQVLALVLETGAAGPSMVSKELGVGLSTAYRDLAMLEDAGFVVAVDGGKRSITREGTLYIEGLSAAS